MLNKVSKEIQNRSERQLVPLIINDFIKLVKEKDKMYIISAAVIVILSAVLPIYYRKILSFLGMFCLFLICFTILLTIVEKIHLWYIDKFKRYDSETDTKRAKTDSLGGSHYMDLKEIEDNLVVSNNINEFDLPILGVDEKGRLVGKRPGVGNDHICLFGQSGGNKGVAFINTTVMQDLKAGNSVVVMSTKDDVYKLIHGIPENLGYKNIHVLTSNPSFLKNTDAIDYLKLIKDAPVEEKGDVAQLMADVMQNNATEDVDKSYWFQGELNFLKFMLLVAADDELYAGDLERTIPGIFKFLSKHNDIEDIQSIFDNIPENHPAYMPYRYWRGGRGKSEIPKTQVLEGLGYRFPSMQSPLVWEILGHDEIDLVKVGTEKSIVFVIVDTNSPSYTFLISLYYTMQFKALMDFATKNGGSLPVPVRFIFDELASCGKIPNLYEVLNTGRSYKMNIFMCTQDMAQLYDLYGEKRTMSMLNNCGVQMLIGTSEDNITAPHFVRLGGKYTMEVPTYDEKGIKTGIHLQQRDLFPLEEALSMDGSYSFVYMQKQKGRLKLEMQKYYEDFPGSRESFYNEYDGKTYYAHPLLKYSKPQPISKRVPKWYRTYKEKQNIKNTIPKNPLVNTDRKRQYKRLNR